MENNSKKVTMAKPTKKNIENYKMFVELIKQKKYEPALDVFIELDLKTLNNEVKSFVLRTSLTIFNILKPSNSKYAMAIINGFEYFFGELSKEADHEKYMCGLNWLTNIRNMPVMISVIIGLKEESFVLESWLRNMTVNLMRTLNGSPLPSKQETRRKLFLDLTGALLFYVDAEMQYIKSNNIKLCQLGEPEWFLQQCVKLKCFSGIEYIKGFDILQNFIISFRYDGKPKEKSNTHIAMNDSLTQIMSHMENRSMSSTIICDVFLTMGKIIEICQSRIMCVLNSENYNEYLSILRQLCAILIQAKSDKDFCVHQCKSPMAHSLICLFELACKIYSEAFEQNWVTVPNDDCCRIGLLCWKSISSINCPNKECYQHNTKLYYTRLFDSFGKTKKYASILAHNAEFVLRRFEQINFIEKINFEKTLILKQIFQMHKTAENWKNMVDAGYTYMALELIDITDEKQIEKIKNTVCFIAKAQKDGNTEIKTPYEFFNQRPANVPEFKLDLPKNFNYLDVSLVFLQQASAHGVLDTAFSNKITHQMLISNKNFIPKKHARFVYSITALNNDEMSLQRLNVHLKTLKKIYAKEKDVSVGLIIAAIDYFTHQQDLKNWNEETATLSILKELNTEAISSKSSVFRRIHFEDEQIKMKTLRSIKNTFIQFIEFFVEQSDEKRNEYMEEKDFILAKVPTLAGEFMARDYPNDAMDMYISLYKLANLLNDEDGLIDACTHFAEYSTEFRARNPFEKDLDSILRECCDNIVTERLSNIRNLTSRKQNRFFLFMLNLALFYLEQNRIADANLILTYVHETNTQINSEAMEMTVGKIKRKSETDNLPKFDSGFIRVKFYSILFQMITKYEKTSCYPPLNFIRLSLMEIYNNFNAVSDNRFTIPNIVFKMITDMVMWCQYRYETSDTMELLLKLVTKFALKYGFARRASDCLLHMLSIDLYAEKLNECEIKFKALELMAQIGSDAQIIGGKATAITDKAGYLREPAVVRDNAGLRSPRCLSPKQVIRNNVSSGLAVYLQDHPSECICPICRSSNHKFFLFEVSSVYARYVYLNKELDIAVKRSVFDDLYKYWLKNRKEKRFPSFDRFYLTSARMLMWCAHFHWKFEKDYKQAKIFMTQALNGLDKVKRCDYAFKRDIKAQIGSLEQDIQDANLTEEAVWASKGIHIMNAKKDFDSNATSIEFSVKKSKPKLQQSTFTPRISVLDMIKTESESKKFEIHSEDGNTASTADTPSIKKSLRTRKNVEENTPSIAKKSIKKSSNR